MKNVLSLFIAAMVSIPSAYAVSGQTIAQCSGTDDAGNETSVRLQITPQYGLTLFVVRGDTLEVMEAAEIDRNDPRGLAYVGRTASVRVPNVQAPARAAGTYEAILTVKESAAVFLTCRQ
jgi:endonuclease YncB( thermonuclease family)